MSADTTNPSLGALPGRVLSTPGGGFAPAPPPRAAVSETDSAQAVQTTTTNIAVGLNDPAKDDTLIEGCKGLGNLVKLRVHPGTPLRDVPHPTDAQTQLVQTAEFTVTALREEPVAGELVTVKPDDLSRRIMQLKRARDLHAALKPVVDTLDLIVRNYEDGIDTDLRGVYKNLASLIDNNARFTEGFGPLKTWATRIGQRAAEGRRKNALRDAQREDPPAPSPAALTAAPASTSVTVTPGTPSQLPPSSSFSAPASASAPRSGRRRTNRRRG